MTATTNVVPTERQMKIFFDMEGLDDENPEDFLEMKIFRQALRPLLTINAENADGLLVTLLYAEVEATTLHEHAFVADGKTNNQSFVYAIPTMQMHAGWHGDSFKGLSQEVLGHKKAKGFINLSVTQCLRGCFIVRGRG